MKSNKVIICCLLIFGLILSVNFLQNPISAPIYLKYNIKQYGRINLSLFHNITITTQNNQKFTARIFDLDYNPLPLQYCKNVEVCNYSRYNVIKNINHINIFIDGPENQKYIIKYYKNYSDIMVIVTIMLFKCLLGVLIS